MVTIIKQDSEHILTLVGRHFIIVGDFNIRDSLCDENYVGNETLGGREFNQFIEDNELILLNNRPEPRLNPETTCIQLTALDLTLTTRHFSRNCHRTVHQNCLGSDHYPIISKFIYQHKSVLQSQQL